VWMRSDFLPKKARKKLKWKAVTHSKMRLMMKFQKVCSIFRPCFVTYLLAILEPAKSPGPPIQHIPVEIVLEKVEAFLLPERTPPQDNDDEDAITPFDRLRSILKELTIGEHIRMVQFLYRDNEDELQVCSDLRQGNSARLPAKDLLVKLTEGRARVAALSRMCYGEDSVEWLRAIVDLAGIYAVQGMWEQVSSHMAMASQRLLKVSKRMQSTDLRARAHDAALFTVTVFKSLRQHAINHRGYITGDFLKEVSDALNAAATSSLATTRAQERQEEIFEELYPESSASLDLDGTNLDNTYGAAVAASKKVEDKTVAVAFSLELEQYLCNVIGPKQDWDKATEKTVFPSWGQVATFLVNESGIVRKWKTLIDKIVLPQNQALLRMVFDQGDRQVRGVCHPVELSMNLSKSSSATKLLSGTQIIQDLGKMVIELPIAVNASSGDVYGLLAPELRSLFGQRQGMVQHVKYELPLLWLELLAQVVFASNTEGGADPVDILRIQIFNLLGLCHVFSNQLDSAEENMRTALGALETMGLEMELIAVDLYNAISQLMVVKHRQWHAEKKERCEKLALEWLQTREGRQVLSSEIKAVRFHYIQHKKIQLSQKSAEEIATKLAVKLRAKHLLKTEVDPTMQSLEAAYRYLVRSYEILERVHGEGHMSVASASLAVASVQNIIANYGESKEWLVRSIRTMEKLNPLPVRAIAFTQIQLASVLIKLRHPKSAEKVLAASMEFYSSASMKKLNRYSRLSASNATAAYAATDRPAQLNSDIETALDLMRRLMVLSTENGGRWQAAEYAESMAELAESAHGWDSQEVAELRKLAADKQCRVQDWGRACGNYKKSLDAHHVVYGEKDKRSIAIMNLLKKTEKSRDNDMLNSTSDVAAEDGDDQDGGSDNEVSSMK
jgi:hypothetical protein